MPFSDYPFISLSPGQRPRPMLPIRIVNPQNNQSMRALGLIDTGADQCSIPADFAKLLGHNLAAGTEKEIRTAGGPAKAYGHTTRIEVFSMKTPAATVHTIPDTPVDFCPGLHVVLLGVDHFLSEFLLTINYPKQNFSLSS